MEWFQKHGDPIIILGTFAACFWNMNKKFNDRFSSLEKEMGVIEKEVAVIKTVLLMHHIMPLELAHGEILSRSLPQELAISLGHIAKKFSHHCLLVLVLFLG